MAARRARLACRERAASPSAAPSAAPSEAPATAPASASPVASPSAEAGTTYPLTLEHKYGSTTIEAAPERIVTVGLLEQDALVALGVPPVGTTEWFGEHGAPSGRGPPRRSGRVPEVVGDATAVNFESIAALDPDVIIALYSGLTPEQYDSLAGIAPTVAQPTAYVDYGIPWQELTRTVGEIVGKPGEADALVPDVEARFEAGQGRAPRVRRRVGAIMATPYEGVWVYGPEDVRGRLLEAIGFVLPEDLAEVTGGRVRGEPEPRAGRHARRGRGRLARRRGGRGASSAGRCTRAQRSTPRAARWHLDSFGDPLGGATSFVTVLSLPYLLERARAEAGGRGRRRPGDGGAVTGPAAVPVVVPAPAATLDETFARLRALTPYVDGRVAAAGAAAPAAPSIDVEALLEGVGAARATADQRVRAMLGLHGSVFYRVMPALGAFLAERRVPCLDPGHTGVDWAGGDVPGRLTTCGAFTALADDPAAHLAGWLAADDDALAASLHAALVDGVAPLVAALARHGPLGERVLWLSASDTIAGGMLWLGELLGREGLAAREAERLLRTPGSPLGSTRGAIRTYTCDDASRTVHVRASCCLSWRLDGGSWCSTCPVLDEPARERLIVAGMAAG